MDALKLDTTLEGLEKFPGEFFSKARPNLPSGARSRAGSRLWTTRSQR